MLSNGYDAPRLVVMVNFSPSPKIDHVATPYFTLDDGDRAAYGDAPEHIGQGKLDRPADETYLGLAPDDYGWYDITDDVVSVSSRIGRAKESDAVGVGTATVTLDNDSGDYDPVASRRFLVMPMAQIKITAEYMDPGYDTYDPDTGEVIGHEWDPRFLDPDGGVSVRSYPIFRGFIEEITPDYGESPTVSFDCVDGMAVPGAVSIATEAPAYAGDTTGQRIRRILDRIEWPGAGRYNSELRDIDLGQSTLQALTWGDNASQLMQRVAESEQGMLYVGADGKLTFRDRLALYGSPVSTEVQAVFSDNPTTASDAEYESLKVSYGAQEVINDCTVTPKDLAAQQYTDATSIGLYGNRSVAIENDLSSIDQALAVAQATVLRWKDARVRVEEMSTEILSQPGCRAYVLGLQPSYRVNVRRTYGNGNVFTQDLIVQGISWDISDDAWKCSVSTSNAGAIQNFFRLDTSYLSVATKPYTSGYGVVGF